MSKIKPITPQEIEKDIQIPETVIRIVNSILKEEYRGGGKEVRISQHRIVAALNDEGICSDEIFGKGYLDFEHLYSKFGWKVEYDAPAYNESGPSTFTFTPKQHKTIFGDEE